jgi:hypothetical protein
MQPHAAVAVVMAVVAWPWLHMQLFCSGGCGFGWAAVAVSLHAFYNFRDGSLSLQQQILGSEQQPPASAASEISCCRTSPLVEARLSLQPAC